MTCQTKDLSQYEDRVVRFQTKIGFLADARVMLAPDKNGPDDRPLLCQLIGPAPPAVQPDRTDPYGPDSYETHAEQWSGEEVSLGLDVVNLSVPDGDDVRVVEEDKIWEGGRYDIEEPSTETEEISEEEVQKHREESVIDVWERSDIEVGEEHSQVEVSNLLRQLEPGDVLLVEVWAKSYPDRELEFEKTKIEAGHAVDERGTEYIIEPTYHPSKWAHGSPWLRTKDGYESRGEIRSVTVVELGDADE